MFSSRRKSRKHYTPPTAASVNPNAATAAVSAYNLSSSAAAAALRALPAAPTNVSAVQTKRTQRRSASLSSEGSRRALSPVPSIKRVIGLGGGSEQRTGRVASPLGVPTLRRRGSASSMRSVSSMSERTFRSPSPHQSKGFSSSSIATSPGSSITSSRNPPINAAGAAAAAAAAAGRSAASPGSGPSSRSRSMPPPPVPAIPQHVIDNHPSSPPEQANAKLKKSRRITSLGFAQQPLRLASQQQQKTQNSSRSSWFGSGSVGDVADIRTSDLPMDINGYARDRPMSPTERPGSRSSLHNFSYPSRQRLSSPPASPTHSRNTSLTEPAGAVGAVGAVGAAGAAFAASLRLRKAPSSMRSVSTERAPKQPASAKSSTAAASRRSASTSRVPGHYTSVTPDQELVYDANSRRMVPRGELLMLEQAILENSAKPRQPQQPQQPQHSLRQQRKKKQQPVQQQHQPRVQQTHQSSAVVASSSLPSEQLASKAAVVSKPKEATEADNLAPVQITEEPTLDKIEEEAVQPVPALSTSASTPSSSVSSLPALASSQTVLPTAGSQGPVPVAIKSQASPAESTDHDGSFVAEDNRPVLAKRPSVVHEDPELEDEEDRRTRSPVMGDIEKARSRSPARTAHFSPVVANNLTVRHHSPPPRSISPRKSAMKQTSSPRDTSPSDSASEPATVPFQPPTSADVLKRKKANRVSFDEKATVLSGPPIAPIQVASPTSLLPGAAEAPPGSHTAHQPPSRSRSWFSNMGRSKKKNTVDLGVDDDDVVMKPRPALPSFGSVRDKPLSASQQEERALVKPGSDNQPVSRPPTISSPPPPSALKTTPLETLNTSSDHAIGSIILASGSSSASAVARNTANTSRYREPLPPVVTSVDGSGYVSDSGASTSEDDDDATDRTTIGRDKAAEDEEHSPVLRFDEEQDMTVPAPIDSTSAVTDFALGGPAGASPTSDAPSPALASPKKTVPAIAISHPSQENLVAVRGTDSDVEEDGVAASSDTLATASLPEEKKSSPVGALFDVPGTFPDTDSESTKTSPSQPGFNNAAVPVRQNAFEPITQDDDLTYSPQMPATVFATHMPTLHEEAPLGNDGAEENDSDSEVFSDAYEDLSDIEGDGFLSLDAVVDSPIVPTFPKSLFGASILPGSPSREKDSGKLEHSALPKSASSATSATPSAHPAGAAATFIEGTSISMSTLMASAASKNAGMGTMDPDDKDDWDKVKAFWRGLSAEKRAQLETEAREDAAADGDLEEESLAVKKPRRKKSVETRLAEKRAIQESAPSAVTKDTEEATARSQPLEHKTEAAAATRIRRSMRDTEEKEAPAALRPKAHARTFSADSTSSSVAQGGKPGVPALMPSSLRRRGSDSSESSFKRSRTGTGFRKSLRAEPDLTAANTEAITLANTAANENLDRRGSRFSLRSLSPTGSTTLRGSAESSPQIRRTLRDGPGFAASEAKRMSSPGPMASATLRKSAASNSSGGGFFSSLGKKSGGKLLQRSKNTAGGGSGGSRIRFGDSSDDDDDDVFGPSSGLGGASGRRSASAGAYTFRSRFVDSSDEDEIIPEHRMARPQGKNHVVPKTMRSSGSAQRPSSSGSILDANTRPGSSLMSKSLRVPEKLEEADEGETRKNANRTVTPRPVALPTSGTTSGSAQGNSNIGTTTLRRTRSGRGQMMPMSPGYSPTTTGTVGAGQSASVPSPSRHRRASSIMSVLRRKKPESTLSPGYVGGAGAAGGIGRGELIDSAARRDTQLERNARELAAMRSSSVGSSQRQRSLNRTLRSGNGSTPRIMPLDGEDSDDLDEDDSEDGPRGAATGGISNSWPLRGPGPVAHNLDFLNDNASNAGGDSLRQKKKKFPALRRMFGLHD